MRAIFYSSLLIVAVYLTGCNGEQQPTFPSIGADTPAWFQYVNPKVFTAKVSHPHLDQWEIVAPTVLFGFEDPPSRSGLASIGPDGTLSFTVPPSEARGFTNAKKVFFKWTVSYRLRGGQELIPDETQTVQSFVIGCLPQENPPNPLANVDRPERLALISPCATFDGITNEVLPQKARGMDGDIHFEVAPDAGSERLLEAPNLGRLVAEIVPADQPGCTVGDVPPIPPGNPDDSSQFGRCTGADIGTPSIGSHVRISGPLVREMNGVHPRWVEIHPVWDITPLP